MGVGIGGQAPRLGFVHRFVPPRTKPGPITLLLLHGTGGDENDLLQLGSEISPGAPLLSPRGKVLEEGMPRFFHRLGEGIFDLDDLRLRTHELAAFVEASSVAYSFDSRRVVAVGYSNGANIATSLLFLHPGLLAAAVLFRPMVPFTPSPVPDLSTVEVLVNAGFRDAVVRREQTEELFALLKRCRTNATLHWEDATHLITGGEVKASRDWLRERIPTIQARS